MENCQEQAALGICRSLTPQRLQISKLFCIQSHAQCGQYDNLELMLQPKLL